MNDIRTRFFTNHWSDSVDRFERRLEEEFVDTTIHSFRNELLDAISYDGMGEFQMTGNAHRIVVIEPIK